MGEVEGGGRRGSWRRSIAVNSIRIDVLGITDLCGQHGVATSRVRL